MSVVFHRGTVQAYRRVLKAHGCEEVYLTIAPTAVTDPAIAAGDSYEVVRESLASTGAKLFSERVFATEQAMPGVLAARQRIIGDLVDGMPPTSIVVSSGGYGEFAGVQVHAVRCDHPPEVFQCGDGRGRAQGRRLQNNGDTWLYLGGVNAEGDIDEAEQARRMFTCAGCMLAQANGSMQSVARTWLWLKDICQWYDELNASRTDFFKRTGLIDDQQRTAHLPASTGIGLYSAGGAACTLDLIAMPGREDEIKLIEAGGDQQSAYEYGSAFSRAAVAPMPAGRSVFISGTAAIDPQGRTEHIGEIETQIDDTISHIRSLLSQLDCTDSSVLTALAYCKTPGVEQAFRERWPDLSWPRLTMNGEVCRPELLFEVEVTARPVTEGKVEEA